MPARRALIGVACVTVAVILSGCATPAPDPSPPPAETGAAVSPAPPATPTPEPTVDEPEPLDCEDIVTEEYRAMVTGNGWVGWDMIGDEIGHNPFAALAVGDLPGQLSCRWGAGPDVPTDNVLDLAWAPIDAEKAETAQGTLEERGWQRLPAETGVYLVAVAPLSEGGDEDGFGAVYHFTGRDVRWAQTRDHLAYLGAPAA